MARRYHRRGHRRGGMKLPIVSLAILGGQVAAAHAAGGGFNATMLDNFASYYTGFSFINKAFVPQNLVIGYAPWLVKRFVLPIAKPKIGGMHLPVSIS